MDVPTGLERLHRLDHHEVGDVLELRVLRGVEVLLCHKDAILQMQLRTRGRGDEETVSNKINQTSNHGVQHSEEEGGSSEWQGGPADNVTMILSQCDDGNRASRDCARPPTHPPTHTHTQPHPPTQHHHPTTPSSCVWVGVRAQVPHLEQRSVDLLSGLLRNQHLDSIPVTCMHRVSTAQETATGLCCGERARRKQATQERRRR
jgi:hypothetical protein